MNRNEETTSRYATAESHLAEFYRHMELARAYEGHGQSLRSMPLAESNVSPFAHPDLVSTTQDFRDRNIRMAQEAKVSFGREVTNVTNEIFRDQIATMGPTVTVLEVIERLSYVVASTDEAILAELGPGMVSAISKPLLDELGWGRVPVTEVLARIRPV